jgi:hypothetical protein
MTLSIARVMMKDGMLKRVRMKPLKKPMSMPTTRSAAHGNEHRSFHGHDLRPCSNAPVMVAVSTDDRAMEEPTERSISPPMMVMVMPKDMTPASATLRKMFRMFGKVKKPGAVRSRTRTMKERMSSIMYFLESWTG